MNKNKLDNDCIFVKKKWISITGLCNNNCLFCLDKDRQDTHHKKHNEIIQQIKQSKEEGNQRLILSGGDPTVHPNLAEFIKYAKDINYQRIQIITNARAFASEEFTKKIINAGINEITISIHGHTPKLHDSLTQVPNSLTQVVKGIRNIRKYNPKIILNTDTVITKQNYKHLLQTIKFIVEYCKIYEINLMNLVPYGNAWKYKQEIMYTYDEIAPYIKETIQYCKEKKVVLWLARFPAKYLEGYEEFIESPYKTYEETIPQIHLFKNLKKHEFPPCYNIKCKYCTIKEICDKVLETKKILLKEETPVSTQKIKNITITKQNYKHLKEIIKNTKDCKKIIIKFPSPKSFSIDEYKESTPTFQEIKPYLEQLKTITSHRIKYSNIPQCMFLHYSSCENQDIKQNYTINNKINYPQIIKDAALSLQTKKESCTECIFNENCSGLFINYAKIYGLKKLEPIKSKEIRIIIKCNQKCIFCNYEEENAKNLFLNSNTIIEQITKNRKQGINYLIITGGEPTIHKDLLKFIHTAKKLNYKKIEIQTNAIECANKEYTKNLAENGLTNAFISLHAHNEKLSSDLTQAPNTFNKTIQGIKNLQQENIYTSLNIVINSLNYKHLIDIAKLIVNNFRTHLITNITLSIVTPHGRAKNNNEILPKYTLIAPKIRELIKYLKQHKIDVNIPSQCGFPICFCEDMKKHFDEYNESNKWSKHNKNRIKIQECESCPYNNKCVGLRKKYAEIYSADEIKQNLKEMKNE